MTARLDTAPAATGPSAPLGLGDPVRLPLVIRSEWLKFWTLRSTVAVLVVTCVALVVIGPVVGYNTRHLTANLQPNDIVPSSPLQGFYLGQLLVGALGVLFVTGEYSTGMIRATLIAVPRRLPVLWAKLVVFVTVTLALLVPASVAAFLAGEAVISHYRVGYSLDADTVRVVLGTGVYLTLIGVIGATLGWIVRSTPGALVAYVALVVVLPVLIGDVIGSTGKQVAEYLPSNAGAAWIESIPDAPHLSPWAGLVVLLAWVAIGVAAAAAVLRRRDA